MFLLLYKNIISRFLTEIKDNINHITDTTNDYPDFIRFDSQNTKWILNYKDKNNYIHMSFKNYNDAHNTYMLFSDGYEQDIFNYYFNSPRLR
jgi:hypothetical protein